MKLLLTAIVSFLLVSCFNDSKKHISTSISDTLKENEIPIVKDTLIKTVPMQIGNDKGQLKILEEKEFEFQKFKDNRFILSLEGFPDISFSKVIDLQTILEQGKEAVLLDTLNFDYLETAVITEIEFYGVRSNTLMFDVRLKNSKYGKEILGRFSLFYRTRKKGTVYGWFTDEIGRLRNHE